MSTYIQSGKYLDINIRKYKTQCCNSAWFYIIGMPHIMCAKCEKDVTEELSNEYERLKTEFGVKLKEYQSYNPTIKI